jgi:hypothetical protein
MLMGVAWDPMRAVGSHWRGEWTLEEFDTIERCAVRDAAWTTADLHLLRLKATHSYGYIARQLGRTYNAVITAAYHARNGEIRCVHSVARPTIQCVDTHRPLRITANGERDLAKLEATASSSSSSSPSSTSSSSLSSSSVPRKRKAATPSSSTPSSPGGSSADISSRSTKKIKAAQPAEVRRGVRVAESRQLTRSYAACHPPDRRLISAGPAVAPAKLSSRRQATADPFQKCKRLLDSRVLTVSPNGSGN